MKELKFLLHWHVYAAAYVVIFYLAFTSLPEDRLFYFTNTFLGKLIEQSTWDETYMSILMSISLALNATLILSIEFLRCRARFKFSKFFK